MAASVNDVVPSPHHEQLPLCETRPSYRQGRKLTAVKVYTISDESKHILLVGVPAISLQDQVKQLCQRYGDVMSVVFVPNYAEEEFTDVYHVQYKQLRSSRFAKRQLDGKEFYGGILHVCYVPEMESVEETRQKLIQRRREVAVRCTRAGKSDTNNEMPMRQYQRKPFRVGHSSEEKILNAKMLQCVWNGRPQREDPRQNFVLSNTNKIYGPQLPSPEWRAAGVREKYLQPNKSTSSNTKLPKTRLEDSGESSSSRKPYEPSRITDKSILRFIPRQIKGLQRRVINADKTKEVYNYKMEEEPPNTSDKSLDATVQAVRDRIRNVSVPNIKIHLSGRNESVLTSGNDSL